MFTSKLTGLDHRSYGNYLYIAKKMGIQYNCELKIEFFFVVFYLLNIILITISKIDIFDIHFFVKKSFPSSFFCNVSFHVK